MNNNSKSLQNFASWEHITKFMYICTSKTFNKMPCTENENTLAKIDVIKVML